MMRRRIAVLCVVIGLFGMVPGCGKQAAETEPVIEQAAEAVSGEEVSDPKEDAAADENAPAADPEDTSASVPENGVEFAAALKLGWNLGNTLDATGESGLASETSWGQPKAAKELFQYVKDSGFSSVRIPVSWGNHIDSGNRIDPDWMARVKEVVDDAIDCGLFVILNSHHDDERFYPSDDRYEASETYLRELWGQIADAFAEYDEHLIFEGMNEPRLTGTDKEWWFDPSDGEGTASIRCIVRLNQAFVDTVRGNGDGYNAKRFLMVPSYAANPEFALQDAFEMPEDPAGRVLVSVHAYSPYDFALNGGGYADWDEGKAAELNFMDRLDAKFIQKGYGVVIGEFGATNKENLSARTAWAKDYTRKAAGLGIPCFLWDNGATGAGEENFGMLNRQELSVYYPELLDAMMASYR